MSQGIKYAVPSHVMATEANEEALLLDLESGDYVRLDEVGKDFWTCLSDGLSHQDCVKRLTEQYEVAPDRLSEDLEKFAQKLVTRGLLAPAEA